MLESAPNFEGDLKQASEWLDQGRVLEAATIYNVVLRHAPNNPEALRRLARVKLQAGDSSTAVTLLQRFIALDSSADEAHSDLGKAFETLGRAEDSLACYRRALAIEPGRAMTHNRLATLLLATGHLSQAVEEFDKAIALAPEEPGFYLNRVFFTRSAIGDAHIAAMEKLAQAKEGLSPAQRVALLFGLGRLYDDIGRQDEAFDNFLAGNELKRRQLYYDEGNTLRQLARISEHLTAEALKPRSGRGHPSALPVFIFGMPRSGTTLVEQILASHPAVFGAGELGDVSIGLELGFLTSLTGSPEDISTIPNGFWREAGAQYIERLAALAPGSTMVTDKTLTNFLRAGLVHLALPNARMIHVRRDAIDTCLSCFSVLFTRGQIYSYELGELGRYYHAYERLMMHWHDALPATAMIEVRYEDIVRDLRGQTKRLLEYCGLDWDDRCLSFHESERPVRTASASQVRQPIYGTSVGRWRPPMRLISPLLGGLGL